MKPLHLVLGILFTLNGQAQSPQQNASQKPNVILIMADDQGWGDLSLHGNPDLSTPNLDQLAHSGAQFQRFYVNAVCSPTRAALLTGRYAVRSGVYATSEGGELMALDEVTMAEVFQANQYRTAAFGKWHNGTQGPYHPNARGFEEFYGFTSGHWGSYMDPMLDHNGQITQGKGFLSNDLTMHAIDFIKENQDQAFFVYLALNTPHSPMQVPNSNWEKWGNRALENQHANRDKEKIEHTKAAYALVENIDWNVGRIQKALDQLQLANNTIVLYLSDNGPNGWRWNGGLKGIKGDTHEGGVRSPLFVSWPGTIREGLVVDTLAGVMDLLPTLLDLTGMHFDFPNPLDGRSLKPLLLEHSPPWGPRFLFSYWKGKLSVREQKYVLDQEGHLYNLATDPGQKHPLDSQFPGVYQRMKKAKDAWKQEVLSQLKPPAFHRFPLGFSGSSYTQLPARDAQASGAIQRSARWPNCSFYTQWSSTQDSIFWHVDVLEPGKYEAILYYTCRKPDLGCQMALQTQNQGLHSTISEPWDPPLKGKQLDRFPREESYVKDFRPISLGTLELLEGPQVLTLKALAITGDFAPDIRLLVLKSLPSSEE